MTNNDAFSAYAAEFKAFIDQAARHTPGPSSEVRDGWEQDFNQAALKLFRAQFNYVPAYRKICQNRHITWESVCHWQDIPAVTVSAFKELELTSLPPKERTTVFHSSGTTGQIPSRHFHNAESLAVYESSLWPWFERHMLGSGPALMDAPQERNSGHCRLLILTPSPALAPQSSLVHMFETVRRHLGADRSVFAGLVKEPGVWTLDLERSLTLLVEATQVGEPMMVLGTAFGWVQLLDCLENKGRSFRLAAGSRALETGGYKGRGRALSKGQLYGLINQWLGISPACAVSEYGMCELSSQAYDVVLQKIADPCRPCLGDKNVGRVFRFPPWAKAQIVSPETGQEVSEGEVGLIKVFDLANLRSVLAVQTEDLGIRRADGFELVGRVTQAEPRGCSLMAAQ